MRLRLGRFAWELYYTRSRAVLPRQEVQRRIGLICGHGGYLSGLLEYAMTDIIALRLFAIAGGVLVLGYQVCQPKVQWPSAYWNAAFAAINIYQLYVLARWLPAMTEEEENLFKLLGGEDQFVRRQFQLLLEVGAWRFLDVGEKLAVEGRVAEIPEVCLLSSGSCDIRFGSLVTGRLGPGSVIGEVWALDPGHFQDRASANRAAAATVAAGVQGARCLCIPLEALQAQPKLRESLHVVFAGALADGVSRRNQDRRLLQYKAVLEVACSTGPDPPDEVIAAIARFRQQHGLTDAEHYRVTEAVPRCTSSRILRGY